ncbi:MAG: DUF4158 domain-containing protein [Caulobacter sp.]|nr:DUF4158 domain-containing protein [Caulobacter sp.]
MARRSLLTGEERRRLFEPPTSDREIATRYTLSLEELDWIEERRRPANKLGAAVQLALVRHPGFGWTGSQTVAPTLLKFIAEQIHVPPEAMSLYGARVPTRSAHHAAILARLGLRPFSRTDLRLAITIAADAARSTDKGGPIVEAVMTQLRRQGVALPSPDTIERVSLAGRAQARRQSAVDLLASLSEAQLAALDQLLVNDQQHGKSALAWLRDLPETPSALNMGALMERLDYVRAIGLPPKIAEAIHERRFDQYVREGAIAPAFLLGGYSVGRRRATVAAQLLDLERRISDAAVDMFEKMVGSLFAKARRGRERQYQASQREVAHLMGLFSGVIASVERARADGREVGRIERTLFHDRLAGKSGSAASLSGGAQQERSPSCARSRRIRPQAGPDCRSHLAEPAAPGVRSQPSHCRHSALEHIVYAARRGPSPRQRPGRARPFDRPSVADELAAHRPHGRLSLARCSPGNRSRRATPS